MGVYILWIDKIDKKRYHSGMNIIALLQMALALLANPQVQTNAVLLAQATQIANTAVLLAEEQATLTQTPPTVSNQTQTNTIGTGSPDMNSVQVPPAQPSIPAPTLPPICTLQFQKEVSQPNVISWTVQNPQTPLTPILQFSTQGANYDKQSGWSYVWEPWETLALASSVFSSTSTSINQDKIISSDDTWKHIGYDQSSPVELQLTIGGAVCNYTITP